MRVADGHHCFRSSTRRRARFPVLSCLAALALAAGAARADDATPQPPDLQVCARLSDDTQRLICYDRLAGRESQPTPRTIAPEAEAASAPAAVPAAAAASAPAPRAAGGAEGALPDNRPTALSQYWELGREDKRGTFRFFTYRPNFMLPIHWVSAINRIPTTPSAGHRGVLPPYRNIETKLQLSIRTKIAQSVLLPDADLWFGYTQVSLWQLWSSKLSSPFRSTDYEPELMYVVPVPLNAQQLPLGWRWRYVQLGLAHQSNGQALPLSRSWNRVYVAGGFEHGPFALQLRAWHRLHESADNDDNPDLVTYRGRGDVGLAWTGSLATASAYWRTNFSDLNHGGAEFNFTYPVSASRPDGLRWYAQVFSGYGETLLDYNFRQTSVGLGVTLFNF